MYLNRITTQFRSTIALALLCPVTLLAIPDSFAADSASRLQQRADFVKAERAIKQGRITQFRKLSQKLQDYPLYPYLEFAEISRRLSHATETEVVSFLDRHQNSPMERKLYSRWIHRLARQGKSKTLVKHFRPTQNIKLICQHATALIRSGEAQRGYQQINDIWLTGKSLPKVCDKPIALWKKAGQLTEERLWARIYLTMNKGKRRLASYLGKDLPRNQKYWLNIWKKVQRQPHFVIKADQHFKTERSPVMHWILVDGMTRLSRKDPMLAAEYWQQIRQKYTFDATETERIERQLALSLARAGTPVSQDKLRTLKLEVKDSRVIAPHILSAIEDQDWENALAWLNRLDSDETKSERWSYWRARVLEGMGRLDEARSLYLQITDNRSYYSFLAADRIGDRYQLTHTPLSTSPEELQNLEVIPAIARAGELFQLNREVQARREWHFAIQSMNKKQLLMAAQLANKWGWHDRSIITLALAKHWDDLELRFPLAHQQQIEKQARREGINPAWAFAVIRQESAFTTDARSSAGALGLMQLMPRTARQVARQMRLKRPRQRDLLNSKINIRLGIRYLRKLNDYFKGNPVLATAAYNAGQWRVKTWLPKNSELQSADLWIEKVPFKETRDYLKRVLTYTIIYEQRLGLEGVPLLERMAPVYNAKMRAELKNSSTAKPL